MEVDHYEVLGLQSGEEGAKLTEKEISKAYKLKALELHPDKRLNDPNAHDNFQKLKNSYEILKDEKARKLFDDLLRVKREQQVRKSRQHSKRRKMVSDLEGRERAAAAFGDCYSPDPDSVARAEEERIARKLKEEIDRIRAMHSGKGASSASAMASEKKKENEGIRRGSSSEDLEKDKVLKVSWEKVGEGYDAEKLRELFSEFGEVDDVVIRSLKKRGSALVVMSTKDAAVAATGSVLGHLSNPLLVVPLLPSNIADYPPSSQKSAEFDGISNLVGAGCGKEPEVKVHIDDFSGETRSEGALSSRNVESCPISSMQNRAQLEVTTNMASTVVSLKPSVSSHSFYFSRQSNLGGCPPNFNVKIRRRLEVVAKGMLSQSKFMKRRKKVEVFKDSADEADQKNWRRLMNRIEDTGSAVSVLRSEKVRNNQGLDRRMVLGTLVRFKQLKKWNLVVEVLLQNSLQCFTMLKLYSLYFRPARSRIELEILVCDELGLTFCHC
ncbi:Pentatricopeptide repeat-containing protein At3g59040 [Linum grandiflorum]